MQVEPASARPVVSVTGALRAMESMLSGAPSRPPGATRGPRSWRTVAREGPARGAVRDRNPRLVEEREPGRSIGRRGHGILCGMPTKHPTTPDRLKQDRPRRKDDRRVDSKVGLVLAAVGFVTFVSSSPSAS